MTMSQTDLTKLLKTTWKALAKADKDDADELLKVVTDLLEKLEAFEVE
jgi:hypothetical protein